MLSAYSTWTVVAIGYAYGYVDEGLLGTLDQRLVRVRTRQSERWQSLLVKVVLMLRLVLDSESLCGTVLLILDSKIQRPADTDRDIHLDGGLCKKMHN